MKDPLLLLLLVLVGIFLYLAAFKGVIYPWLLLLLSVVTALWYLANHFISKKMVEKTRKNETFFFQRAQMIDKTGTELISGALVVTKDEVVFVKRKGYFDEEGNPVDPTCIPPGSRFDPFYPSI